MTTEIMERPEPSQPALSWTHDQVDLIKRTMAVGATDDELKLFLYQAKRTGLDPLSRQIHFVKRKDKAAIQTAIDGYRLVADRTGKYAGSDDYTFDEGLNQFQHIAMKRGQPVTATVTVWKIIGTERCPFTATASMSEYRPADEKSAFMWNKMPYLMIGKCAEALALRKAFPAELSGLYTDEEMEQAGSATNGAQSRPVQVTSQSAGPFMPGYAGEYANKPVSEMTLETLKKFLPGIEKLILNPERANWKAKNEAIRDAMVQRIQELDAEVIVTPAVIAARMEQATTMKDVADLMNQAIGLKEISPEDQDMIQLIFDQRKAELTPKKK